MKKTYLLFARYLTLLVLALMSTNLAWGKEGDTHDFPQNISQLLNNDASIESITISNLNYPIKAIKITCRYNKATNPAVEISATVGGNTFGSTISVGNNFNGTKDIEGTSANGQIVIAFSNKTGSGTGHGTFYVTNVQLVEGAGDTPSKTLTSIAISGTPTKTTYETDESFDPAGLTVTGTYSDKSTDDVTDDVEWTFDPATFTSTSQTSVDVTATVDGKSDTKSYNVTVTEPVITPGTYEITLNNVLYGVTTGNHSEKQSVKVNGITVVSGCTSSASSKTYYDPNHIRYYADSYLKLSVPTGYLITSIVFTEPSSSKTWNGSITSTPNGYNDQTKTWTGNSKKVDFAFGAQNRPASIKVTYIRNKTLESIAVTKLPAKSVYKVSEEFDASGLEVMGTYTDETSEPLSSTQYTLSSPDMSIAGQKTVTVSATGVESVSFNIDVVALDKIEITTPPTTTEYNEGDNFNSEGMVVKGTWGTEENKMIVVDNLTGYTITDGTNLQPSQTTVTVSYTHEGTTKTTTQGITVTAATNKYAVTFESDTEEGTLTVKVGDDVITTGTELVEGVKVYLASTPKEGYKQQATPFVVKDADGGVISVKTENGQKYFEMPAKAVTITAKFVAVYAINVAGGIQGGTIAIQDKDGNPITETSKGSKVVVAVTPNDHHSLTSLFYIKAGEETHVDIEKDDKGVYSFTMIESAVTVYATFAEDAKYTVTFSVNGENTTSDANYAGEPVEFPTVSPIAGYTFMGWTDAPIIGTQQTAPEYVTGATYPDNNDKVFYAVFAKKSGSENYVKVTLTSDLTDGKYLIVDEKSKRAFNGIDAANGYVTVTISDGKISDANGAAILEIKSMTGGYSLEITNGEHANEFIYGKSNNNSIQFGATAVANEISFSNGAATILSNSTSFRYNATANQDRFRFYRTSTTGDLYTLPALYKKQEATYSNYTTTVTTTATMSITSAKWSTFIAPFDVEIPEGVEAYTVAATEDALVYTPVETTIPACTPVVLFKDVAETYKQDFVGVDNAEERTFQTESLVGTLDALAKGEVPTTTESAVPVYLLQKQNEKVGFFKLDPTKQYSLNANRAYLVGVATANAKAYYGFDDNDPTGISNLRGERWNVPREGIFDLSGRKLSAPQKGVNIINGIKVIVK